MPSFKVRKKSFKRTFVQGRNKEVKTRRVKARALYFWSAEDVNKWLKKHGGQYHLLYADVFKEHEINGEFLQPFFKIFCCIS